MNNLIPYNDWVMKQHEETASIGTIYGKRAKDTDGSLKSMDDKDSVFLTFDLCPSNGLNEDVIEFLKTEKISCSIFCSTKAVEEISDFDSKIKGIDCTIEGHGNSHKTANELSETDQYNEIAKNLAFIKEKFGTEPKYYRFPNGISTPYSIGLLRSIGVKAVSWFNGIMDSRTRKSTNVDKTNQIVVNDKFNLVDLDMIRGKIFLFHLEKNGDHTIQFLKEFVEYCKSNKLSIKKLS